jgi:hypothetical protein
VAIISAADFGCNFTFDELIPTRVDAYADVIHFHLWDALGSRERARWHECMREHGGYDNPKFHSTEPHRFWRDQRRPFRERRRVEQPPLECLRELLDMRGNKEIYLTYGERALDPIFPQAEVEAASFTIRRHLTIRNHRSQLTSVRGTMYLNPPQSRRNIGLYHDLRSKLTGEPCVHMDYRMKSHAMLVANRLGTLEDWLYVDDHAFFAPRLILMDLDYGRLGRLLHNMITGDHRRANDKRDRRHGLWDFFKHGLVEDSVVGDYLSVQKYLDRRRRDLNVYSCLIQLDNYYLLPQRRNPNARNTHYTDQAPSACVRNLEPVEWALPRVLDRQHRIVNNFDHLRTPVVVSSTSKSTPIPRHRLRPLPSRSARFRPKGTTSI